MSDLRQELLAALISGPGYGLELMDRLRQRNGGNLSLASENVYPVLRSLEREGFLSSFEGETVPERAGRPRIYYELTGMGRRAAFEKRGGSKLREARLAPVLG